MFLDMALLGVHYVREMPLVGYVASVLRKYVTEGRREGGEEKDEGKGSKRER